MRLKMNAVQEILQESPELFCLTALSYTADSGPSALMIHLFITGEVFILGPGTFWTNRLPISVSVIC